MRISHHVHPPAGSSASPRHPRCCSGRPVPATATGAPGAAAATTTVATAYTADGGRPPDRQQLTARVDHRAVRHLVQRCRGRRGIQRDGLEQERHHRQDAGVDEQAGHRVERPDPLGPRQAVHDPGAHRVGRQPGHRAGLRRPQPHQRSASTPWRRPRPRWLLVARISSVRVYVDDDVFPTPVPGLRVEGELRARLDRPGASAGARPAQELGHQRGGGPLLPRPAQGARHHDRRLLRPGQRRHDLHGHREQQGRRAVDDRQPDAPATATTRSPRPCTRSSGASSATARPGAAPAPRRRKRARGAGSRGRRPLRRVGPVARRPAHRACSWPGSSTAGSTPATAPSCGR